MKTRKNRVIIVSFLVIVLGFIFFNVIGNAFANNNDIAIKNASITGIDTGTSDFDSDDGLNGSFSEVNGYIAGNDNNKENRIVRTFDELVYHFDFAITGKNAGNDYEDRKVKIKVTLPEDVAKYVSFDKDTQGGIATKEFIFDGIDSYGSFQKDITLYVLGAPNGTEIKPKFEIQESTNTDNNFIVTLGNISGDTYNYEYDSEATNKYSTVSNVSGFSNYMPTIVSSKTAAINVKLLGQTAEGQKATYNDILGRYLTYLFGIEIVGNDSKGIKGSTMPNGGDITFNIALSQDGNIKDVSFDDKWSRLYSPSSSSGIEPIVSSLPYSEGSDTSRKTRIPGTISITKNNDNSFTASIKGYNITYSKATINADNSNIAKSEHFIGTYALSIFSGRNKEDAKNDITTNMTINNINVTDTTNTKIPVPDVSASSVNKYYENIDYSLLGEFYNMNGSKLSQDTNGKGSTSKGTNLVYKTTFNYKKTLSDQGLKEIIKIDPNAFRVIPNDDKDIRITIENSNGSKLSQDDFEIKYITGDYKNDNYSAINYNSMDNRLNNEDLATIQSSCSIVNQNLKNYSVDQVMNLYGGPCIKANENTEATFDKISNAKNGDSEVPITKIIVQTKKGVKLPDSTKVVIEVGLRVRDISDITQTYQVTALAMSSDYDSNITYYAPRIGSDEDSITSPDNYRKTIYNGNNIVSIDDNSVWGDSLKIVNFTSREVVTVTNKNTDGTVKTHYNANKGETINYNVKTIINDNNQNSGADDVWYINNLKVYVTIPKELTYVADKKLGNPEVLESEEGTTLVYTLPYTKPNMKINDINFKAIVKPDIKGSGIPVTVSSKVVAININNETDTSYFGDLTGSFTIYATGIENVIVSQKVGSSGSVVEKDSEFSYVLSGYNNTGNKVDNYNIVDVLPGSGDNNGSTFSGSYKVKVTLPSSLNTAKVYCSKQPYTKLSNEVFNKNNNFEECNITDEYVEVAAIKITDISINADSYMDDIIVSIKPTGNDYSDKYINSFVGASETYSQNESNKIETRVVSRNISGRVFVDVNENGIEDENEQYLSDIPVTLYKLDSDNKMSKVLDSITDKNGAYKFKNLDTGRYKVRLNYDNGLYDLTLRYATEDITIDSDAYKISDGVAEISNKRTPEESDGIKVTREIESVENMNVGLISRKTFGFDISKYITKIDLNYNNQLSTYNYDNQSKVVLSVKNSLRATARVYYGIRIENNSTKAGYVKLINENIPEGLNFNSTDSYNAGWFYQGGELRNASLENTLINPGESKYLQIALDMPRQEEARTFINTVTLLDIAEYQPETLAKDTNADSNSYELGEEVSYAGINWHVINVDNKENGEQLLTMLADSGTISSKMGHTSSKDDIYKWSNSLINSYINGDFTNKNSLNLPILNDSIICDDASGLPVASGGGALINDGICQSAIYNRYKVRLLTEKEFEKLLSTQTNLEWLTTGSYWLENSSYVTPEYDVYGVQTNSVSTKAKAVVNSTSIQDTLANTELEVRPVITISNRNIISE